jgi:hypothetical protein
VDNQRHFRTINYWSRKFHIHLALFLLLFIWLFSFSGLLLNHGKWKFASFWNERKEKITNSHVRITRNLDSAAMLGDIMQQLKISGEVNEVRLTPDSIDFRVSVPGRVRNLHVDLENGSITQRELTFNWWGKIRTLHTFNGANKDHPQLQPNWKITRIWKFAMDAIAIGLVILCISSWVMWYKLRKTYTWGPLILVTGFAITIYFVFLLRML